MSLNYHDVLTLPFLELWCDWTDSGQGLACSWQPPAASCQSAAREHHVKVRDKDQREHVNTPNEKAMTSCIETGGEKWYCALKLIHLMLLLCYQYFLYDILLSSVLFNNQSHCGR